MNQIKELKIRYNKDFKIEFTLLLLESQKKITISLIISEPVTVLELKEFISKDFDFPVKDLIIFYPLKGIMENSYIFNAEPNEKILLDLIYDDRKNDINNLNNDLRLKQNEYNNFQNTINFDYHIKENKNIITNIIKSDDKEFRIKFRKKYGITEKDINDKKLDKLIQKHEGKEIEVHEQFRLFTCEVISRTAFGSCYLEGKNTFDMLMKLSSVIFRNFRKLRVPGIR